MKHIFDQFVVNTSTHELRCHDNAVPIEPKAFDVLCYLIENNDHVVSKDELVQSIWDGRAVSDAAVSSAVRAVRNALGDDGKGQRIVKTVHGRGFRFIAPVVQMRSETPQDGDTPNEIIDQEIRFCQSADGTQIAYATAGNGPPLVKAANWLSHLEFDWESPVWSHFFSTLVRDRCLVRYDARGNGLSDWEVSDHGFNRHIEDLEAVVDSVGLSRFPMIGISQGCMRAIAYAAKYPDRVEKLILIGGYVRGWQLRREDEEGYVVRQAANDMIGHWWGQDNQAIRQLFTSLYMPDAPAESQRWFTELQRKTASSESAAAMLVAGATEDIGPLLAKVKAPTLVIHARRDVAAPFDQGREMAQGIPGARFASLDTSNHLLPESDPEWQRCKQLISEFLAG